MRKLMIAEHGVDYQVVDDSGGDGGLDGFNRLTGDLHAFYCPEKPAAARYRQKYHSDLKKTRRLRDEKQYSIRRFVFVIPEPMREPEQRTLRDLARKERFDDGINMSGEYLEVLLANHPEILPQFPEISYPQVEQKLDRILNAVEQMQSSQASAPNARRTSAIMGPAAQILTLVIQAANKVVEARIEAEEIIRLFDFTKVSDWVGLGRTKVTH